MKKLTSTLWQQVNKLSKKVRFLMAGGINTVFGLMAYPLAYTLLKPIGGGYMVALLLASIVSVSFSFLTSKYYVFKTKGNVKKEYVKFFTFYGIYLSLNIMCLPILVEVLKITPIISQTLFSILIIITSYFWHDNITFSKLNENV